MKVQTQGLALALWLFGAQAFSVAGEMEKIDICDFKPVFSDDFQSLSISPRVLGDSRWIAHTPWNGDFGDAAFSDPAPSFPFTLRDGGLAITASRNGTTRWRSGLIAAADSSGQGHGVQYGYFEARMRLPPGPGTWPAFWLASLKPVKDVTPGVEIDVIEYYGHADYSYSSALHVWYKGDDKARSRHKVHKTAVPPGSLVTDYHDYGLRITPEEITYYLDRFPVWRQPTPPELKTPMYPLVNLALGSGFPIDGTPDPSTLLVKYVNVYAYDPSGRSGRCPG
jgi:beta-glucanase (GH16 family)